MTGLMKLIIFLDHSSLGWLFVWLVVLLVVLLVGWFVGKAKIGFAKNITKCCYGVRDKKDLRF